MNELNEIERGQICVEAYDSLRTSELGLSSFPGLLKKLILNEAWKRRELVTRDGRPKGKTIELSSLRELITEKPLAGWGEDPKKIEAVIKDNPEVLAMYREAMKEKTGPKPNCCDNVTETESQATGNSKAYTVSRLQREAPELYQAVCDGKMSANAAAIEAGFRRKPTPEETCIKAFSKCESKLVVAQKIIKHLDAHEREIVRDWLEEKQ
jgi:hypothetical protein